MAKQVIGFEATLDGAKVEKSVKSIKTELREAQNEAINLARKFGDTSDEALAAAKRVANLRDEVADFKQRVEALNPDKKFAAFSQSLQGVAGGFAGLQGAIGLFGTESKDLEKQLLKVQSALALSEGLNAILESKDAFANLKVVAVDAFKGIKTAIGSTGIGLLVVALGTIYAYWDDIKAAVTGVSEEQQKLNRQTEKNIQAQKDKLSELDSQDAVLKQQGLSERQILKLKEAQTKELIKQQIVQLEGAKAAADAELKRTTDMYAKTASVVGALAGTAAGISVAGLLFNPAETQKKGADNIKEIEKSLKESKNKLAEYQNQVIEIDNQDAETKKQKRQEAKQQEDKIQSEKDKKLLDDIKKKKEQADYESQVFADTVADLAAQDEKAKQEANDRQRTATKIDLEIAKANYDAKKKLSEDEIRYKQEQLSAYSDLANNLAGILGRQTAAGKAMAIAGATIDTYKAANSALKADYGIFGPVAQIARFIAVTATIANGIRNVKQIASVQVPGGGGGSNAPMPNTGGMAPMTAPIASAVQVQQAALTQGGNNVNIANQGAVKAFVVERDITDSQDRISKIKSAATF